MEFVMGEDSLSQDIFSILGRLWESGKVGEHDVKNYQAIISLYFLVRGRKPLIEKWCMNELETRYSEFRKKLGES